jgi:hypothetical protein
MCNAKFPLVSRDGSCYRRIEQRSNYLESPLDSNGGPIDLETRETQNRVGISDQTKRYAASKNLRVCIAVMLVVLTAQGWTGDYVNLFAVFPTAVTHTMSEIFQALSSAGVLAVYHALEGLFLVVLSLIVLALSFKSSRSTPLRICAIIGTGSVISAAFGGLLFVLSDFLNNANSAQMGGSFLGAYAFFFLALYYTKS